MANIKNCLDNKEIVLLYAFNRVMICHDNEHQLAYITQTEREELETYIKEKHTHTPKKQKNKTTLKLYHVFQSFWSPFDGCHILGFSTTSWCVSYDDRHALEEA